MGTDNGKEPLVFYSVGGGYVPVSRLDESCPVTVTVQEVAEKTLLDTITDTWVWKDCNRASDERETCWHISDCPMNYEQVHIPKRILRSGNRTIVFWKDGTKTIVKKCEDCVDDSPYTAFTAALAKKIYGSNSALKRIIAEKLQYK